jgi:hypothetical protein
VERMLRFPRSEGVPLAAPANNQRYADSILLDASVRVGCFRASGGCWTHSPTDGCLAAALVNNPSP